MNNNVKQIIKDLIYIVGIFLLICLLLLVILLNSYFYPPYVQKINEIKMNFLDCDYWKNSSIPEKLNFSQKWIIITTIGECKIMQKKYFLEQNINDKNSINFNLFYIDIRHKERLVGEQAKSYLDDLNEKSKKLKINK